MTVTWVIASWRGFDQAQANRKKLATLKIQKTARLFFKNVLVLYRQPALRVGTRLSFTRASAPGLAPGFSVVNGQAPPWLAPADKSSAQKHAAPTSPRAKPGPCSKPRPYPEQTRSGTAGLRPDTSSRPSSRHAAPACNGHRANAAP